MPEPAYVGGPEINKQTNENIGCHMVAWDSLHKIEGIEQTENYFPFAQGIIIKHWKILIV